jgi:hypothetical protein
MEEVWEFHSPYQSSVKYAGMSFIWRLPTHLNDTTIYKCWSGDSTKLLLGTSAQLSKDVIHYPVMYIPPASWKLSVLYSMRVRQYALSPEAYKFLELMKKNTEQLGSVFDSQPSELTGNIRGVTDPNEIVIGFVEVTQEQQQRIFIYNSQVPGWGYTNDCPLPHPVFVDKVNPAIDGQATFPAAFDPSGEILSAYFAPPLCVDCTLRGVNKKPAFWP